MELELDGEPRNRREAQREESPHATRWRVGEQDIVADLDLPSGAVVIRVGERTVGELSAGGGSYRFTLAAGSGYRGGDQIDARVHRDVRTGVLTLWVGGIEVTPIAKPAAPSTPDVEPPKPPARPLPDGPRHVPRWVAVSIFVVLIGGPTAWYVRSRPARDAQATADLEAKTAECLRRADAEATAARARAGNDPNIEDRRRLRRIACKQYETDCKRDPRSLPCVMGAK